MGRVTRAHGVRGEVAVQPLSEVPERFAPGSVLLLGPDGDHRLTVAGSRPHQNRLLVKFREVGDRDEAEALRGRLLLVAEDAVPPIDDEDRFWVHQVAGLDVVTEDGRSLGRIREVLANPANDVWVTEGGALIPAVRDIVVEVDVPGGRAVVRDVPGLLGEA